MNNRNPDIIWTLNVAQANVVLFALGKRPYEEVADVMEILRSQAQEQMPGAQTDIPARRASSNGDNRIERERSHARLDPA